MVEKREKVEKEIEPRGGDSYLASYPGRSLITKKLGGAHVLNVKLWGWDPRLHIIRPHESELYLSKTMARLLYAVVGEPRTKLVAV